MSKRSAVANLVFPPEMRVLSPDEIEKFIKGVEPNIDRAAAQKKYETEKRLLEELRAQLQADPSYLPKAMQEIDYQLCVLKVEHGARMNGGAVWMGFPEVIAPEVAPPGGKKKRGRPPKPITQYDEAAARRKYMLWLCVNPYKAATKGAESRREGGRRTHERVHEAAKAIDSKAVDKVCQELEDRNTPLDESTVRRYLKA